MRCPGDPDYGTTNEAYMCPGPLGSACSSTHVNYCCTMIDDICGESINTLELRRPTDGNSNHGSYVEFNIGSIWVGTAGAFGSYNLTSPAENGRHAMLIAYDKTFSKIVGMQQITTRYENESYNAGSSIYQETISYIGDNHLPDAINDYSTWQWNDQKPLKLHRE